ncbi:MAG: PAS domain S-box-containing protein, partial [Myxococcota bacterium]
MIWKFDGEDLFDLSSPPVDELLESMGVDMRALEGATVLVTGGARGIGRQAALGFASLGAHVIVVDKQPAGQAVVDDITGADGSARFALVDIVEAEAFASVLLDAGPVDILVNNAVEFDVHSIVEMALADWDRKHAANSRAPFQATKAVLPGMLERGRGVIVNLIAPSGIAHAADMSASKAGLRSLTVSLAAEVGTKSGVSVYGFAPGLVATQLVREVFPQYAARLGLSFREYVERVRPNPGYSGLMPAEHCGASLVATALSATEHHGAVADAFRPLAAAGLIRLQPIQLETSGVVATPRDNAPRLREHVEAIYAQRLEEDRQVGISAQERAGLEAERDVRQTALLDVADRFKHLSGTSADAIVCADDEGNIVSWNTAAERLFGLTVSEALGRSVVSLVPALEADDVEGVLDTWGRRANGSQFPVQVSVARWATGGHGQIGLIVRDVSRRTAAEEDVRTLASIVRHSNDAIVTVSPDGILLSWNLSAERMFGYTASEIVGQPARILVPPERVSEHRAMMAVANHAGGKAFETVRLARDGTAIDVSLMVSQLRDADGIPIGTSGIIRDIREAKRAEERERLLIAANASTLSAREKARALERALHELQVA